MQLEALSAAIDELTGSDPSTFGDAESVVALHTQLARLDAFVTAATAAFDSSGAWSADGAQSCAAWVSARVRLPKGAARRRVRLGARLRHLPVTSDAWLAGEITDAHVASISAVHTDTTAEALRRDEEMLVEHARTMRFESFARVLAYWAQCADPDGAERDAEAQRNRRDAYLDRSFDGMWLGKMTFDPVSGAVVSGELDRLVDEFFQADWDEARQRLGRDPKVEDLHRTSGQRRADAFVEMATRSGAAAPDARRPRPLFSVFVGYETLHGRICELAQGVVLSPGMLVPWITQADFERAVFKTPTRLEVSTTTRLFSGATRRAIELRDRRCTHPYCDRPAEICQADHIDPFAVGGLTTQENGRMLCGFHNRLRNQRPPPPAAA